MKNSKVIPSAYYGVREPEPKDMYGRCVQQLQQMLCEGYPRYVIELVLEHDFPIVGSSVMKDYNSAINKFYM